MQELETARNVALAALGGLDMISVYVRSSLIQLYTPDAMRAHAAQRAAGRGCQRVDPLTAENGGETGVEEERGEDEGERRRRATECRS